MFGLGVGLHCSSYPRLCNWPLQTKANFLPWTVCPGSLGPAGKVEEKLLPGATCLLAWLWEWMHGKLQECGCLGFSWAGWSSAKLCYRAPWSAWWISRLWFHCLTNRTNSLQGSNWQTFIKYPCLSVTKHISGAICMDGNPFSLKLGWSALQMFPLCEKG